METFEYRTVFFGQESVAVEELNLLGASGWRVIHVLPPTQGVKASYLLLERQASS
jgi:hypothetical protein